jgi:hypothetical protein
MDSSKQTEGDRKGAQEAQTHPAQEPRAKPPQKRRTRLVNPQDRQLPESPVLNPKES